MMTTTKTTISILKTTVLLDIIDHTPLTLAKLDARQLRFGQLAIPTLLSRFGLHCI